MGIRVDQGEIVGLLGPNGAGKTTTFYMIVGLIPPNQGQVYLDERELTEVPMYQRARMGVGYLAQEPSVFRKLTVEENVMAILETLGLPKAERKARLEELLNELSIAHLRTNKAYSLSGGERRRLEITRALVQRPKFMLLDEPFAGIDPIAVNDIQQIVHGLKDRGIGAVISDHNVEQTLEIVDRAYIMYEGRIRVSGTVSELVWNDEVADIYFGPTLTARMRSRYARPQGTGMSGFNTRLIQSVNLRQEMKINPRLYQAMELLYMPLLDLQQHLKQELAENPFLEMTEADVEEEVELEEERKDDTGGGDRLGGDPPGRLRRRGQEAAVRTEGVLPAHAGRRPRTSRITCWSSSTHLNLSETGDPAGGGDHRERQRRWIPLLLPGGGPVGGEHVAR